MASIIGSWKLDTTNGFNEIHQELGTNMMMRRMLDNIYPTMEISESDGKMTQKITSTSFGAQYVFKPGEETPVEMYGGVKAKLTATKNGNTLNQTFVTDSEKILLVVLEPSDTELIETYLLEDTKAVRKYKKN